MIRLEDASCHFGKFCAVSRVNLQVATGETFVIIGTSGCGKSTTLKMINGLIRPTTGLVYLDDEPIDYRTIYSWRLRMGYVIQGAGLFPHLTVHKNISIMARMLKWDRERINKRVSFLLELVGLDERRYANKYPVALSGGERQRVGFARALMLDPPVMLMDEPFGALDSITRDQLQRDFLGLKDKLHKTTVMVTHDLEEAFLFADHLAIMDGGKIIQHDTPDNIRRKPANEFVRKFLKL